MNTKFRPMLAYSDALPPFDKLRYPLLCSPKIDGIRAVKLDGKLLSRRLKPIPNVYVRETIENSPIPDGFDGELVCPGGFNRTTSAIMSREGQPPFSWQVFDWWTPATEKLPYRTRAEDIERWFLAHKCGFAQAVLPDDIWHEQDLLDFEAEVLEAGYEGAILRSPNGPYKRGRSTLAEGYMLKLKRFKDSEAVIVDFEELMHNENVAERNELGYTERSSALAGQIPGGTLGALYVVDEYNEVEFSIGSGFTKELRDYIWNNRETLTGKVIKYKYQPHGKLNKPRHPVFLGFRDLNDI